MNIGGKCTCEGVPLEESVGCFDRTFGSDAKPEKQFLPGAFASVNVATRFRFSKLAGMFVGVDRGRFLVVPGGVLVMFGGLLMVLGLLMHCHGVSPSSKFLTSRDCDLSTLGCGHC